MIPEVFNTEKRRLGFPLGLPKNTVESRQVNVLFFLWLFLVSILVTSTGPGEFMVLCVFYVRECSKTQPAEVLV